VLKRLSSRLTCSQDICSRSAVRASDTLTGSLARYKLITYLLTCRYQSVFDSPGTLSAVSVSPEMDSRGIVMAESE